MSENEDSMSDIEDSQSKDYDSGKLEGEEFSNGKDQDHVWT